MGTLSSLAFSCVASSVALSAPLPSSPPSMAALSKLRSATSPTFSPDGKQIAFVSTESGTPQIWQQSLGTTQAVQLTHFKKSVLSVSWSPTGKWLAYSLAPDGGLNVEIWAMRPDGTKARRLSRAGKDNNWLFGWTRDGKSVVINTNREVPTARNAAVIDVETGKLTLLSRQAGFEWVTEANREFAVIKRSVARGNSDVHLLDRSRGIDLLLTPHEGKAQSSWGALSADRHNVYVLSNVGRDKAGLGVVSLQDNELRAIRYLSTREDAETESAMMSHDGKTLAYSWNVAGRSQLILRDLQTDKERTVNLSVDVIALHPFSLDDSKVLISGESATDTTDIYVVDIKTASARRITRSRHDDVDLSALVKPTRIDYRARDGVALSGWLYRPANSSGPTPMVFDYHGGPESQSRPTFHPDTQALVAKGFAVFAPNVRGSSGFGKAFLAMDDKAKRMDAVSDIEATSRALVEMGYADPHALGIMGGSYGGYMTMMGITQFPTMFAAAVNLYGIVNFESFFAHTEPWMAAISTIEYGDPRTEVDLLRHLSPIHKVSQIVTPLFVLHGKNDTNVPLIEAEQVVASLRARNVPVRYTLFGDEGHGWLKSDNIVRSTREITNFFADHLKPKSR